MSQNSRNNSSLPPLRKTHSHIKSTVFVPRKYCFRLLCDNWIDSCPFMYIYGIQITPSKNWRITATETYSQNGTSPLFTGLKSSLVTDFDWVPKCYMSSGNWSFSLQKSTYSRYYITPRLTSSVFLNLFDLLPKIAPQRWVISPVPPQSCKINNIRSQKCPFISVAHPIKRDKWQTIIISVNATVWPVFVVPVSQFWVLFGWAWLIEKTAHYPNQKAPLPNVANLPPGWEPIY